MTLNETPVPAELRAILVAGYELDEEVEVDADGEKWSVRAYRLNNVTYLSAHPAGKTLPILNFPADETEYRREMERRYTKV